MTCLELKIPVNNRYQAELNDTEITGEVDEGMCVMFEGAGTRPTNYQLCNEQSCPFWRAGEFSDVCCTLRWIPFSADCIVFIRAMIICLQCSVTCGGGVRMRDVECVMELGRYVDMNMKVQLNLTTVNDSLCNEDDRPSDTKDCNRFPCFFKWRVGPYGQVD